VFRNEGAATLVLHQFVAVGHTPVSLVVRDFDGDKSPDIAILHYNRTPEPPDWGTEGAVTVFFNQLR
jgi:hypothetical protein